MTNNTELSAFVLLIIGTLGLLLNEFVLDLGRVATLLFAAANVMGLVTLGSVYWSKKQRK